MIIDTGLDMQDSRFADMDKENVRYIVIHHTGVNVDQTVETINNFHKNNRGWAGIGYHFYIRQDGSVYKGRPMTVRGVHTPSANSISLGVALAGDFSIHQPTDEQKDSLVDLIRWIFKNYKKLEIKGHNDFDPSECPGTNFPMQEIKDRVVNVGNKVKKEIEEIKINIKGEQVDGYLIDGRAFWPVREGITLINYDINWDDDAREVTID